MTTRRERPRGREGSALVLAMLGILVIMALIVGLVQTSHAQWKSSTVSLEVQQSWYFAHAGLWASAQDLAQSGGTGNVSGNSQAGAFAAQTAADTDADGWQDFSADGVFRAAADGYFEARARDVSGNQTQYLLRARAKSGGVLKTLEAMVEREFDAFTPFTKGAFGDLDFHLDSNVMTDSYDSDDGEYFDDTVHPVTATDNGEQIRNQKGSIASNGNIDLDSNTHIYGDAQPGPGKTVTTSSSAAVEGSTTPLTQAVDNPTPTWTVPASAATSNATIGVGYNGNFKQEGSHSSTTLAPGKYVFSKFELLDGTVTCTGGPDDVIEIYITGGGSDPTFMLGGNSRFELANHDKTTGPTVIVYNVGKFKIDSNAEINTNQLGSHSDDYVGDPIQFQYYTSYSGSDDGLVFSSNGNISAVFYAPEAPASIDSNFEIWGAIVAHSIEFKSNAFFHYDESLANFNSGDAPDVYYVPQMVHELR